MISVERLTKTYGKQTAVREVTFDARAGSVVGLLGPNGAGKTTILRMLVGLVRPSSGEARIQGERFARLRSPLRSVGTLLDGQSFDPRKTGSTSLRSIALTHGIDRRRVIEVAELTGSASYLDRKVGTYSLGMKQRLGVAAALLGDPPVLLLDEPVNGLDPEGVAWLRGMIRRFATEGRTVLLSSHLMTEMSATADRLLIMNRGRLIADDSTESILSSFGEDSLQVRSPDIDTLLNAVMTPGTAVKLTGPDSATVSGVSAAQLAQTALDLRIIVTQLSPVPVSLERAYFRLIKKSESEGPTR